MARTTDSSDRLYGWAEKTEYHTPFVADRAHRSSSSGPSFADSVDRAAIAKTLRANGVVDVEPYRKLAQQLRVGMFPPSTPTTSAR